LVIGEPQRAFSGNDFALVFPRFVHYGVALWAPEVGGATDPVGADYSARPVTCDAASAPELPG
jgi:hypothetical protein